MLYWHHWISNPSYLFLLCSYTEFFRTLMGTISKLTNIFSQLHVRHYPCNCLKSCTYLLPISLPNTSFHKIAYYIHTAASGSLIHSTYVLITKRQWTNAHVRREDSRLRARHFLFIFLRYMTIILLLLSIYNLIYFYQILLIFSKY